MPLVARKRFWMSSMKAFATAHHHDSCEVRIPPLRTPSDHSTMYPTQTVGLHQGLGMSIDRRFARIKAPEITVPSRPSRPLGPTLHPGWGMMHTRSAAAGAIVVMGRFHPPSRTFNGSIPSSWPIARPCQPAQPVSPIQSFATLMPGTFISSLAT